MASPVLPWMFSALARTWRPVHGPPMVVGLWAFINQLLWSRRWALISGVGLMRREIIIREPQPLCQTSAACEGLLWLYTLGDSSHREQSPPELGRSWGSCGGSSGTPAQPARVVITTPTSSRGPCSSSGLSNETVEASACGWSRCFRPSAFLVLKSEEQSSLFCITSSLENNAVGRCGWWDQDQPALVVCVFLFHLTSIFWCISLSWVWPGMKRLRIVPQRGKFSDLWVKSVADKVQHHQVLIPE